MIRIEIEAIDAAHCRAQLQELLRMYPSDLLQKFTTDQKYNITAPEGVTLGKSPVRTATDALSSVTKKMTEMLTEAGVDLGDVVEVTNVTGTDGAALVHHDDPTSPVRATEGGELLGPIVEAELDRLAQEGKLPPPPAAVAKRGRGRPPKAQPAVAQNTGSAPAGNETPPAEGADAAGIPLTSPDAAATVAATPAASSPATNAQMRAALQEMVEAVGEQNTGQILAKEILAAFKYQKVGQVQDEHCRGVIDVAKSALARLSEETDKASRLPIAATITAELAAART